MSKWQTAFVVLAGLGSFVLVKAVAGGAGFLGARDVFAQFFNPQPSWEQITTELHKQGFRAFDAMKQELPADHDDMARQLQALIEKGATQAQLRDEATSLMLSIRRKHARRMHEASDDSLTAALKSQIALLELVASRETPAKCAQYAVQGPAALANPDNQYRMAIDAAATDVFKAMGRAIKNPQPVEPPTDSDWAEMGVVYQSVGGTDKELLAIITPDPKDEKLCAAAVKFYRSILTTPGASGRRVRAEILYAIAAE